MSNRDYYGDNVPSDLAHNNTSTDSPFNYVPQNQPGGQGQQIQPQYHQYEQAQWADHGSRQDAYHPNSKLNSTLPEGQGEDERGLGSTVVGGAGVSDSIHSYFTRVYYPRPHLPSSLFRNKKLITPSVQGAFVGHAVGKKSDHGTLGAIGGAVAGAIAANMASNMMKQNNGHGYGGHGIVGSMRERRRERLERRLDSMG
jgi:small subunit ribosomal protein S2